MSDEVLDQEATMKALGDISLSTLYRMIKRREITPLADSPVLKRRRSLKFARSEVERTLRDARDKEAHSYQRIAS